MQHNDPQHNDLQHNGIHQDGLICCTQHNRIEYTAMLSVIMPSDIMESHYAE
jgi:hypothetical protein